MRKIIDILIILFLIAGIVVAYLCFFQNKKSEVNISSNSKPTELEIDKLPATKYVTAVDWPASIQIIDEPYSCTEAGDEFQRAGITEEKTIGNKTYCVTKVSEGAAGSVYTQYAYARAEEDKTRIATFSFRFVQCVNYDEPQQSECKIEQENFNSDLLVN